MLELLITSGLRIADVLTIHTRNSVYEFFVIDPVRAYGMVKGGAIGKCAKSAFLCQPIMLSPGSKVRLLIETAKGIRYITTSTIKTINRLRR